MQGAMVGEIKRATALYDINEFEQLNLLHMVRRVYSKACKGPLIASALRKARIWPVKSKDLLACTVLLLLRAQTQCSVLTSLKHC